MRYVVETNAKDFIEGLADDGTLTIIEKYEPIERLTARMEKMRMVFLDFKKNRGSWKILNYYLRGKGIAQYEINNVLAGVEKFLEEIVPADN